MAEQALVGDTLQALPHHLLPPCQHEYKGGARFYGEIVNFKREGKGIMTYPDGDLYEGHFSGGVREGSGTQKWLDGSVYQGPFKGGMRHGKGVHQWVNGEVYEGSYTDDKRDGTGVYHWPNGDRFEGDFVNDEKHGKGKFFFSNGNVYEGEYMSDDRLGQGTMCYKDRTMDVGRWRGCSLIKLTMSVLPPSVLDIADKRPEFELCDLREVTKGFVVREREATVGPKGVLETASQAMLLAALKGDSASVAYLLQHMCVRPDVADTNGLTPLLAASVLCHEKVVNILLDNGADVNQLTDAGISPLVACHIHLYCNTQCGYAIAHRTEPLCTEEGPLEGPLADFDKGPAEDGEELVVATEDPCDKIELDEAVPAPTADSEGCTTIVVYGKRHFVKGEDVLKNLNVPKSVVLPTTQQLRNVIKLLLKRGADPKIGEVPVPALILAILARDVESVALLLSCGANPQATLSEKYGRKSPLHVACTLIGPGAPQIVELLLKAKADPNVRDELSFSRAGALQWKLVEKTDEEGNLLGSTPLQVACSMDQDYDNSTKVIELLLQYGSETNIACSGHSPLTLAIYSGNDAGVALLLANGADPSFSLGAPIGSALCSAVDTTAEHRRTNEQRLAIINQLMAAGADIMAFVPVSKNGKQQGTAVDYAMNVFYQDKRIAHTPFHALTPAEREIYIARTNLLNHMATLLREEVQRREAVLRVEGGDSGGKKPKILFKYCYECGRSAGKLCPCTRCYTVSFCSQRCKLKAWTSRHRRECIKLENKRQDKPVKTVPVKETKSKTDSKPDLLSSTELSSILLSSGLSLTTEVHSDTLGQYLLNEGGEKVYMSQLVLTKAQHTVLTKAQC